MWPLTGMCGYLPFSLWDRSHFGVLLATEVAVFPLSGLHHHPVWALARNILEKADPTEHSTEAVKWVAVLVSFAHQERGPTASRLKWPI